MILFFNELITIYDDNCSLNVNQNLIIESYNAIMSERVLVVEDEINLQETLAYNLVRAGYDVVTAADGNDAVSLAFGRRPDLILLDIMLPGMDGFEVCRIIRQEMSVPIIFLTARDDEIDRVVGLELGGDDYVTKPFSMRELLARIHARLRTGRVLREVGAAPVIRTASSDDGESQAFGNLQVSIKRREALLDGKPLVLSPREFDLIQFFAHNMGRTVSRRTILKMVWGYDYTGDSRTVDVHVRWLREKIEKDPARPKRITTVRNEGYRFVG